MMWPESLTPIIAGILGGLFGLGSNWISGLPKRESNNIKRVNDIVQHYENMHQNCEARYERACKENKRLRDKIKELKEQNNEGR
ncbi:hypothetical protein [Salinicoccus albus]|uniref:hypothetical protein n=1 Tax=Salinicoccus albus TaxID=418756 RepID=UPI00039AE6A9|nr:hypothetical protein [Salinicoccus albus]